MREIANTDHAVEALMVELVGAPPRYIDSSPTDFIKWCDGKGLPWRPAAPAAVGLWLFEHAAMGIDALLAELAKISAAHASKQMADPTLSGWPVGAALSAIGKVERPRSWSKERDADWQLVPYSLKVQIAKRETERDNAVRKSQNDAADARRKLLALQNVVQGKSEPMKCGVEEEVSPS
jgi:hypothetical protein